MSARGAPGRGAPGRGAVGRRARRRAPAGGGVLDGARLALVGLTVVRMAGRAPAPAARRWALLLAPAVGLALGLVVAVVLYGARSYYGYASNGQLPSSAIALSTLVALTGGRHLLGLGLVADRVASPPTPGAVRARRSRLGTAGLLAVVLVLGMQLTGLIAAVSSERGTVTVLTAVVAGRLTLTWRGVLVGRPRADRVPVLAATVVTVLAGAVLTAVTVLHDAGETGPTRVLVAAALAVVLGTGASAVAARRPGGAGPGLGDAAVEVAATVVLLLMAGQAPLQ